MTGFNTLWCSVKAYLRWKWRRSGLRWWRLNVVWTTRRWQLLEGEILHSVVSIQSSKVDCLSRHLGWGCMIMADAPWMFAFYAWKPMQTFDRHPQVLGTSMLSRRQNDLVSRYKRAWPKFNSMSQIRANTKFFPYHLRSKKIAITGVLYDKILLMSQINKCILLRS